MQIFLDVDGVLANFNAGAIEAAELPLREDQILEWDYYRPYMTTTEFWKKIEAQKYFWEDLPLYPWASELLEMCESLGEVTFATAPGLDPDSASGKLTWLRRHGFLSRSGTNYWLGSQKWQLAGPGRVLIDDSPQQVKAFLEAGGDALMFPQPWNCTPGMVIPDRVEYIRTLLEVRCHWERTRDALRRQTG